MKGKEIQRYALDSDGNVLDVRSLAYRSGSFFCPNCHDAMIAKMGNVKAWHFAHEGADAPFETPKAGRNR